MDEKSDENHRQEIPAAVGGGIVVTHFREHKTERLNQGHLSTSLDECPCCDLLLCHSQVRPSLTNPAYSMLFAERSHQHQEAESPCCKHKTSTGSLVSFYDTTNLNKNPGVVVAQQLPGFSGNFLSGSQTTFI